MLKGMRGRRKASNVEPDTAEGVVKGRSQTSTQALNAVLNGQCGTHSRCVKNHHAHKAQSRLFKAVHFPLSTGRGAGEKKGSLLLAHAAAAIQVIVSASIIAVAHDTCARVENPAPEEVRQICSYLDLATRHPCVL